MCHLHLSSINGNERHLCGLSIGIRNNSVKMWSSKDEIKQNFDENTVAAAQKKHG